MGKLNDTVGFIGLGSMGIGQLIQLLLPKYSQHVLHADLDTGRQTELVT